MCYSVLDGMVKPETLRDADFGQSLFRDIGDGYGGRTWSEMVLECNRQRDTHGAEIAKVTTGANDDPGKKTLRSPDLEPKVVRGFYDFGALPEPATALDPLRQKYVYVLSRSKGLWTMIIPYSATINDIVPNRVDLYVGYQSIDEKSRALGAMKVTGHAADFYDETQVEKTASGHQLRSGAVSIVDTICKAPTYFPGQDGEYRGKSGADAHKRDPENKYVSTGRIEYVYSKIPDTLEVGCRVQRDKPLYRKKSGGPGVESVRPDEFVIANFIETVQDFWRIDGVFELKLYIRGRNDESFPKRVRDLLQEDDRLTVYFGTKFPPYGFNQMYKSNPIQFNNFSTMTSDDTYHHEVGHAFGLDDEYGFLNDENGANSCKNSKFAKTHATEYVMCKANAAVAHKVYHYIAVSRYVTRQSECDADSDCGKGRFCDMGLDLHKNQCLDLKSDGVACALVGGDHQCKSGHCGTGRCFTPQSVPMGGTCYSDAACKQGKCSSIDGTQGTCVCREDSQCADGHYCDAGVDLQKNQCVALKPDGAACALVGGDHQCKGGHCGTGRCYTTKSIPMGGTCYSDAACKEGKCSSIDGTKGTCVCNDDSQCAPGRYCDGGLDFTKNACRDKLGRGLSCGKAGSVGNDHKCKSDQCSGFPDYVCK